MKISFIKLPWSLTYVFIILLQKKCVHGLNLCFKFYITMTLNWVLSTNLNIIYIQIDVVEEAVDDVVRDAVEGAVKDIVVCNLLP